MGDTAMLDKNVNFKYAKRIASRYDKEKIVFNRRKKNYYIGHNIREVFYRILKNTPKNKRRLVRLGVFLKICEKFELDLQEYAIRKAIAENVDLVSFLEWHFKTSGYFVECGGYEIEFGRDYLYLSPTDLLNLFVVNKEKRFIDKRPNNFTSERTLEKCEQLIRYYLIYDAHCMKIEKPQSAALKDFIVILTQRCKRIESMSLYIDFIETMKSLIVHPEIEKRLAVFASRIYNYTAGCEIPANALINIIHTNRLSYEKAIIWLLFTNGQLQSSVDCVESARQFVEVTKGLSAEEIINIAEQLIAIC
jgi:hypothetical protein